MNRPLKNKCFFWETLQIFILVVIALAVCMSMTSCTPPPATAGNQAPTPAPIIYQYTLSGAIDGNAFQGVFVGTDDTDHDIKVESPTDVNIFTVQTCHRFFKAEDVISTGWFKTNRGYDYDFSPSPGIEDTGLCIIRLGSYTKQVGAQQAHAIGAMHTSSETLPGTNICDGSVGSTTGLSFCSTMVGLIERLEFPGPVLVSKVDLNGTLCQGSFVSPTVWQYKMPLGECAIEFMEAAPPHRIYHHVASGFNAIQYQGAGQ